jgi:uncharacterized membrane protein YedE/YeeE
MVFANSPDNGTEPARLFVERCFRIERMHLLPHHLPWFIVGPLIGLVPVALYAIANRPLGASGAYLQAALAVRGRATELWRAWFFIGLIVGVLIAAVLQGGPVLHLGYTFIEGWLNPAAAVVILFLSGLVMGYGARWAGGCTSGHGLCGTSARAIGSFVATAMFFVTAIVVTLGLHLLTGGRA